MVKFWRCEPDKDRIVSFYQHKDLSFKSNQVKRDEMTWYEMQGFFTKMIRNDMKGCKRIKDVNRTEYLQRTLHQNDRSPFLDVAGANTCNSIWPFLVCLRSGMAKKFKVSFWYVKFHNILYSRTCWRDSIFLWFMNKDHSILPKLVPEVYGLHPHAAYRAKKSKLVTFFPSGTLQAADVWASHARSLGKAQRSTFLFGSLA